MKDLRLTFYYFLSVNLSIFNCLYVTLDCLFLNFKKLKPLVSISIKVIHISKSFVLILIIKILFVTLIASYFILFLRVSMKVMYFIFSVFRFGILFMSETFESRCARQCLG